MEHRLPRILQEPGRKVTALEVQAVGLEGDKPTEGLGRSLSA
ncbi:MAG: hypothetical protein ACWGSQ_09390 [Longimicrobiales bacterium]